VVSVILAPISIFGLIPFWLAVKASDKITQAIEFKASLYFALSYLFYWIVHNVLFVGSWVVLGIFPALIAFFVLHLIMILGWRVLESLIFQLKLAKVNRLNNSDKDSLAQVLDLRTKLKQFTRIG
jgi:hypothetical protein